MNHGWKSTEERNINFNVGCCCLTCAAKQKKKEKDISFNFGFGLMAAKKPRWMIFLTQRSKVQKQKKRGREVQVQQPLGPNQKRKESVQQQSPSRRFPSRAFSQAGTAP